MPLTAPTLTITDAATSGDGTATIAGGDSGATNTLYRRLVDGSFTAASWTSTGSRTGDGTIAISGLADGFYWWYVSSTLSTETVISNLVYQNLTDGEDAVFTRAIDSVVATLIELDLEGVGGNVVTRPLTDDMAIPSGQCIVVAREEVPTQYRGVVNSRDDLGYPIQVMFFDQGERGGSNMPVAKYDLWRQSAERSFRNQRLTGLDESTTCDIEPLKVINLDSPPAFYAKLTSGFTIRAWMREVRGFGS